jgi:hypothetical protein
MYIDVNSPECVVSLCIIGVFIIVFSFGGLYILIYNWLDEYDKVERNYGKTKKNAEK